jgi:glucose uptake protein GlcU
MIMMMTKIAPPPNNSNNNNNNNTNTVIYITIKTLVYCVYHILEQKQLKSVFASSKPVQLAAPQL